MSSQPIVDVQVHARGVIVPVRASAGARQNGVLGVRNGALRVAVTAAPEKGKANKAIVEVLSKALRVSKSSIEIVAGETSPQKRFLIIGSNVEAICQTIQDCIDNSAGPAD